MLSSAFFFLGLPVAFHRVSGANSHAITVLEHHDSEDWYVCCLERMRFHRFAVDNREDRVVSYFFHQNKDA